MPTVEDYFDDDTELPLPSSSSSLASSKPRVLRGEGHKGALLEEITEGDDFDYGQMADQGRGIFGESSLAPPPSSTSTSTGSGKGKDVMRDGELRPAGGANANTNTPMGGFMGDMMKFQQAEEERVEKMRKQLGEATVATDTSIYKE